MQFYYDQIFNQYKCKEQKIQYLQTPVLSTHNPMLADQQRTIQLLEPLIKLIKDREVLYFDALSFAIENIQSSSNENGQIFIFSKFLTSAAQLDAQIVVKETCLLGKVGPNQDPPSQGYKAANTSKQMMRLSARVLQILQSSIQKARGTLFGENGKLGIDFTRFKKALHRTIRQQAIDLADFARVIINFVKNKYRRQIIRIRSYLNRLQAGENISLRDLFVKEGSDGSVSPQDKPQKYNKSIKPHKKLQKQVSPQNQSTSKRQSTKKVIQPTITTKIKRTLNLNLNLKTKKQQHQHEHQSLTQHQHKTQKTATAALLLKFYIMMDLNKKQFLEDYIFQKNQQQKHRKRLITQLMDKNNKNAEQIKQYYQRCQNYNPSLCVVNNSSDQNPSSYRNQNQNLSYRSSIPRNQSSVNSKGSMKTSFVISRRKGSFVFQTPSDRSDVEHPSNNILPFSKTIKNFSLTKRTPDKKQTQHIRPKPSANSANSKKIFVIKTPMNFDDEIIPKAELSTAAWIQPSLTGKDKSRRNQHIRLKKRNNPVPLDQKYLPDSFRVSQYPI